MFHNLDMYLLKDSLTQNLKAQFEAASQDSLTPVSRRPSNKPQARQKRKPGPNPATWGYKPGLQEPEQN